MILKYILIKSTACSLRLKCKQTPPTFTSSKQLSSSSEVCCPRVTVILPPIRGVVGGVGVLSTNGVEAPSELGLTNSIRPASTIIFGVKG